MSIKESVADIHAAIAQDKTFLARFIATLDREAVLACLNKVSLNPFPADVETVELAIWDNDHGKAASRLDSRYSVQVKANRMGNTNMKRRDFEAFADLVEPKKLKRRSRNWALNPTDKANLDTLLEFAESQGLLIGRFMRMVKGQGKHTFENHYALVTDLCEGAPKVILKSPSGTTDYLADKVTDAAGKPFRELVKGNGARSKVVFQCRYSTAAVLENWTK